MNTWEADRTDWSLLDTATAHASDVPHNLARLAAAGSEADAAALYWRLDNEVVVQGALYSAAVPAVTCALQSVQCATPVARPYMLDLLVQICSGTPAPGQPPDLARRCRRELLRGAALIYHYLENGTDRERELCVDLVGLCALADAQLVERTRWYLARIRGLTPSLVDLVDGWIAELNPSN